MNCHVNCGNLELFEEDFYHFLFVFGGVHIGFGEEDGAFIGCYLEKGEGVFPEVFHVVPVIDDAVGDGVLEFVQSSFVAVEFFSDVGFLLVGGVRDDHFVLGSSDAWSLTDYIEGKMWGNFYYPLKPTFMRPLPCISQPLRCR